jgi:integrase
MEIIFAHRPVVREAPRQPLNAEQSAMGGKNDDLEKDTLRSAARRGRISRGLAVLPAGALEASKGVLVSSKKGTDGSGGRPASFEREAAVRTALDLFWARGYAGVMTAHGFRSTASTLLNESRRWSPDAIERALAHEDKNAVRAAYNRTDYWDERVEMMQWRSDRLDALTAAAK